MLRVIRMKFLKALAVRRSALYICIACCAMCFCVVIFQSSDRSITTDKHRRGSGLGEVSYVGKIQSKNTDGVSITTFHINVTHETSERSSMKPTRSVASAMLEESQLIRQKHLATSCARTVFKKSTVVAPDWSELYVDDDRRYVYCLVSKVSCTSWKRTLLWMTGKVPSRYSNMNAIPIGYIHNHEYNDQVMNRMINLAEPERERRLYGGNYYKFMFVREPLDRLVSAYRDKVLSDPAYHIDEYILKHHHTKRSAVNNITEQSLISRPVSQAENLSPRIHTDKNQTATKEPVVTEAMPTFAEFIDYVLAQRAAGKRLDRHWLPQSELCSPCLVNYDFIGHQESLHADAEYVLDILRNRRGSNSTTKPLPSKYTDIKFPDSDASHGYEEVELERRRLERKDKSDRAVNEMLAQLNDVTLRRIVDLYDADYQLFGFKRPARLNTR